MTQHYTMLARNLLNTGVTRGKKLVVLVGNRHFSLARWRSGSWMPQVGRRQTRSPWLPNRECGKFATGPSRDRHGAPRRFGVCRHHSPGCPDPVTVEIISGTADARSSHSRSFDHLRRCPPFRTAIARAFRLRASLANNEILHVIACRDLRRTFVVESGCTLAQCTIRTGEANSPRTRGSISSSETG